MDITTDIRRRLATLERLEANARTRLQGHWPAHIDAAKQRQLARLWRRLGALGHDPEHPRVRWAQTTLRDDTPAQAEADRETLRQWAERHPETLYPDDPGLRERVRLALEELAGDE